MKLFNINLNINSTKNILKFLLLAFIVILCIYILYISSLSTIEGFAESKDCSNCQIMPSSGNCIKLYDFSYSFFNNSPYEEMGLSFEKIDTSYIFCPYEPKCKGDDYNNIMTPEERQNLSNEDIELGKGGYNINCCSGSPWFEINVSSYKDIYENINERNYTEFTSDSISNKCNQFKDDFLSKFIGTDDNDLEFNDNYELLNTDNLTEATKNKLNIGLRNNNYSKVVSFCRTHDKNHPSYSKYMENKDFSGMLFKRDISNSGHILQDPKLLPKSRDPNDRTQSIQELLDAQRMLSISMEEVSYNVVENGIEQTRFETRSDPNTIRQIKDLNNDLENLNTLRPDFDAKFIEKQDQLAELYKDSCGNYIEFIDYKYVPYKPDSENDLTKIRPPTNSILGEYVLLEDQFLNCFGDISNTQNLRFASGYYADKKSTTGRKNFFGVSEDASYSTQNNISLGYGPSMDLAAEFRHLESVNVGGTAPTGVIDQYLRAINGFYEKQMSNMLGPRTHAVNQQVVFENDGLKTKESTFFVYDNEPNIDISCQPSITGNDKFKTCGPSAYYSEFKS